ncbi:hypothetical protein [Actinomadura terrae]|uniref:hypothetical protein n=1 Tax=Actinomadura terrae TaxID=604353 RepID=UPI001FA7EBC7|nr:hypothetical protein [Actinomadura terrae]
MGQTGNLGQRRTRDAHTGNLIPCDWDAASIDTYAEIEHQVQFEHPLILDVRVAAEYGEMVRTNSERTVAYLAEALASGPGDR